MEQPFTSPSNSASDADGRREAKPLDAEDRAFDALAAGLTAPDARRFEDRFLNHFEHAFREMKGLFHPHEGRIYDLRAEREFRRQWDDGEESRRLLLRAESDLSIADIPLCRAVQYTLVRKPLFGPPKPRLSVVAAAWSSVAPLLGEASGHLDELAGLDVLDGVLERALVEYRPEVYYYIALCSTAGWEPSLRDPLPEGDNYSVALVEPQGPGWVVYAPEAWPPALYAAVDPEDDDSRRRRIEATLRTAFELEAPGGLLLIDEVAERSATPYALALDAAAAYAAEDPELVVEKVEGSMIVRRRRAGAV